MEIIPNWHPIFVHFTVALFLVSAALFLIESLLPVGRDWRITCLIVARWNLWIGAAITGITLLAGWQAYNTVAHDTPSHAAMTDHKNWAFFTAGFFALLTVWSLFLRKNAYGNGFFTLAILVAATMLGTTAFKGAEVVFRYGIGVMSMPKSEGAAAAPGSSSGKSDGHSRHGSDKMDNHGGTPQNEGAAAAPDPSSAISDGNGSNNTDPGDSTQNSQSHAH